MALLDQYHNRHQDQSFSISAEQGSRFAQGVAGDFNPIHNPESPRFCVPGDLLFAMTLREYGLRQAMTFRFLDLVGADMKLSFDASDKDDIRLINERQKVVLEARSTGSHGEDLGQIESLIRQYVAFSGQNFPHILVPLMQQHDVMINPQRPLVIYESMSFELDHLDFSEISVTLGNTELDVEGKRGRATLQFEMQVGTNSIGNGVKTLLLSGLRPFDKAAIDALCADYLASKEAG